MLIRSDPVAIDTAGQIFAYLLQALIRAQIFHVGCELPGLHGWLIVIGRPATTLSSVAALSQCSLGPCV